MTGPALPPWHDLLAAIVESLDVPLPADYADMPVHLRLVQTRAGHLRGYLGAMVENLDEPDIHADGIRRMAETAPVAYDPDVDHRTNAGVTI